MECVESNSVSWIRCKHIMAETEQKNLEYKVIKYVSSITVMLL